MLATLLPSRTLVRLAQFIKHLVPDDLVAERGIGQAGAKIECPLPTWVTVSGIVMLVRLVQEENARSPIRSRCCQCDASQAGTVGECAVADAGDAVADS